MRKSRRLHTHLGATLFILALFVCCTNAPATTPLALTSGDGGTMPSARMPHGAPTAKWGLWTNGILLRGANIYQRRVYPALDGPTFMGSGPVGPPYTQADFHRLAALGANYVNISHPGLFVERPPFALDEGIQANLDELLHMITQADMFAVISFRTGPGRSEFSFFWDEVGDWFDDSYLNDSLWQDRDAQDAWVAMWRYTAQRYRQDPIVVGYDLMVEPNSNEVGSNPLNDPLDIWDPEEFYATYGGTLYDWNQLYPRITAAIRQVDPDTPLLIGSNGYSAVDWLPYVPPTGDPHTVYTAHQYAPHVYTHQWWDDLAFTYPGFFDTNYDGVADQFNRAWLDNLLSTLDTFADAHGVPVAVNEFGVVRWVPGAADFMDDQMGLLEQRGINYALWLWETSWAEYATEVNAFNFRHGPNPHNHSDVASSALMDVIAEHWGHNTIRPSTSPTPRLSIYLPTLTKASDNRDYRQDMRDFVQDIGSYAKGIAPGFALVPQNGQELFTENGEADGALSQAYLAAINSTGREDLFYGYDGDDVATPTSERDYMIAFLEIAERNGIEALVIDYCRTPSWMTPTPRARQEATSRLLPITASWTTSRPIRRIPTT